MMPQNAELQPKGMPYQRYWPPRESILPLVRSMALPSVSNWYLTELLKVIDIEAAPGTREARRNVACTIREVHIMNEHSRFNRK